VEAARSHAAGSLASRPKAGAIGFQDHALPAKLRNFRITRKKAGKWFAASPVRHGICAGKAEQDGEDRPTAGCGARQGSKTLRRRETLARVARLSWLPKAKGKSLCGYRLHTQFEVLRGVPSRIDVTPAKPKGEDDERAVLARTLDSDRMYITDRGYAQFALWNAIVAKGSSYCCRIRDNSAHEVVRSLDATDADRAVGVVSDEVVTFGGGSKRHVVPDHPVRIVTVRAAPHGSRGKSGGGRAGPSCDGFLRIATNRLDLPAELISEMYRLRWLIENFFRMFKQLLGCRHLLSTKPNGVEIQVYCGIIACLLVMLYTGRTPTKRTFEMVCFFLSGWASPEDLERHINALPKPV